MLTCTCTKCLVEKQNSEFNMDRRSKSGIQSACKVCSNLASRKWYLKNAKEKKAYKMNYYYANSSKVFSHNLINNSIKYGLIDPPENCSRCTATSENANMVYHHPDYNHPAIVISLCKSCHYKVHQIIKEKSNERK